MRGLEPLKGKKVYTRSDEGDSLRGQIIEEREMKRPTIDCQGG